LLHAWRRARQHSSFNVIVNVMRGLHQLYRHTGRRAEWRQLVVSVVPIFVDGTTDRPLPEREENYCRSS
jgi:hypothetical protein